LDILKKLIREVPDFPKPGILFYDITTLLKDPRGLREPLTRCGHSIPGAQVDVVIGIESRGFYLCASIAYALGRLCPGAKAEETAHEISSIHTNWNTGMTFSRSIQMRSQKARAC